MKKKINAVLSLGVCAFAILFVSMSQMAFAADAPTVKVGVVAQRYPWNGMVDVQVKVAGVTAESGATLTISAAVAGATALPSAVGSAPRADREPITVATVTGVKDGEQTVSFNANDFDALKGKRLKDVKITAKVE